MATVRESHRRAAPLGAVDRIPWGDGAADIDPPRAPAIVFETSRTGIWPLAVHGLDSCVRGWVVLPGRSAHYQAQNTVSGANLLFWRRLQRWERHDLRTEEQFPAKKLLTFLKCAA